MMESRCTRDSSVNVLHVSPSFYPAVAYGGPIFSTLLITDGISEKPTFEVEVLTTDTADPNSNARLELTSNPSKFSKGYSVRYCRSVAGTSISLEMLGRLPEAIRKADVVHLTGPYNFPVLPTLLLCRIMGKPIVWSPRGGFQATHQWTNAPKKKIKKAFEILANFVLPSGSVFHVTAKIEEDACTQRFNNAGFALIPNAINVPAELPCREWRPNGQLRLAFLSRVHPKKGLDLLLPALAQLPERVTLDIYGDGDKSYIADLKEKIEALGLTKRVTFLGYREGEAKTMAFTQCDLFILPTHSENFGIVIAEALAHGTPVLTTRGAPWEKVIEKECGVWTDLSVESLAEAIRSLDKADLPAMGKRGRDWMLSDFSTQGMVAKFVSLYTCLAKR